jgi:hypothetical protein
VPTIITDGQGVHSVEDRHGSWGLAHPFSCSQGERWPAVPRHVLAAVIASSRNNALSKR